MNDPEEKRPVGPTSSTHQKGRKVLIHGGERQGEVIDWSEGRVQVKWYHPSEAGPQKTWFGVDEVHFLKW